jgi:hypothetical protein
MCGSCLKEPFSDTDADPMDNCPLLHLTAQKVRRLRDLKRELPRAANNRKKISVQHVRMGNRAFAATHCREPGKGSQAREVRDGRLPHLDS